MNPTLKFKFTIAYDGSNYQGWQTQKSGVGVQQKIEEALTAIFNLDIRLHSSSRTDTGVHARGMVAHCEIPASKMKMPVLKLPLALNAALPEDIRIMEAAKVKSTFHARFDAAGKEYRYFIYNHHAIDPLLRATAWHIPRPLDYESMREAAKFFIGRHDFQSFAASRGYEIEDTVRTIFKCDLTRRGREYRFIIQGDGFLYKMCRGIVGTLAQVGLGQIKPPQIAAILKSRDRSLAGMTAPAHGLVLWKVFYASKKRASKA